MGLVLSSYRVGSRIEVRLQGLAAGPFYPGSVCGFLGHTFSIYLKCLGNDS